MENKQEKKTETLKTTISINAPVAAKRDSSEHSVSAVDSRRKI